MILIITKKEEKNVRKIVILRDVLVQNFRRRSRQKLLEIPLRRLTNAKPVYPLLSINKTSGGSNGAGGLAPLSVEFLSLSCSFLHKYIQRTG